MITLIFILLMFVFILIMVDYFLINRWTKSMEKSIDSIFDKVSKSTFIVLILSIFGLNDENKDNENN